MANAARIHAVERGKDLSKRAMVAFGGAAPLHAARLAEKLDVQTIIVPTGAGVGSALGFLLAPVAFEVVRTRYWLLDSAFDLAAVEELRKSMREETEAIIRQAEPNAMLDESLSVKRVSKTGSPQASIASINTSGAASARSGRNGDTEAHPLPVTSAFARARMV